MGRTKRRWLRHIAAGRVTWKRRGRIVYLLDGKRTKSPHPRAAVRGKIAVRLRGGKVDLVPRMLDAIGHIRESLVTENGVLVEIDSAGGVRATDVERMLRENGIHELDLHETLPSGDPVTTLIVNVQDRVASQASTGASGVGTRYNQFHATIYLEGANSTFAHAPDAILSHETAHVITLRALYLVHQRDWSSYLEARGFVGHPKLDSEYKWDRREIIADDWRLLLGSETARRQWPTHLNREISDPRAVAGLAAFLDERWSP